MEKIKSAVEWLEKQIKDHALIKPALIEGFEILLVEAKQMEKEQEYETKAFWFGRGILAGKENRIEELKPIKDNGEV